MSTRPHSNIFAEGVCGYATAHHRQNSKFIPINWYCPIVLETCDYSVSSQKENLDNENLKKTIDLFRIFPLYVKFLKKRLVKRLLEHMEIHDLHEMM